MLELPLTKEKRTHEWNIIQNMARNTKQQQPDKKVNTNRKWATFTYYSSTIRKITNLFKHTDIRISFKNNNTVSQIFRTKQNNKTPEYNKSGIYKLTYKICQHTYIGQTSGNLKQRYQEHIRYIRNNNPQSAYAQHIFNNRHEYGTIEEIMKLIQPTTHTSLLIPYEALFIQLHQQKGQLITEQTTGEPNPLFQLYLDTTQKHVTNRSIQTDTNTGMCHELVM
jgi:hypothetical protein